MDEYFLGIEFRFPSQQTGPPLIWFKPENFKKVIAVCSEKGLGISVIEVYKDGYAYTLLAEDFGGNPFDANWYTSEYENLIKKYCTGTANGEVLFSGWYVEPADTNITSADNGSNAMSRDGSNKTIRNKTGFWSKIKDWWS